MLSHLIHKEFLQIRRNAFLPRLIIMFPIVIMCVMPWVMSMEVKNIRVSVVDNERTTQSQQLVHAIEASRYFIFCGQKPSYQAALAEVEKGDADIILEIKDGRYLIAANAVNGTKGGMGSAYLSQIILESPKLGDNRGLNKRMSISSPSSQVGVESLFLYNKNQNYKLFMIPALLAIVMMLSKWAFILSKLIPYWFIALFVVTVSLVLAWAVYGITCAGSLLWVYVLAMLLALFFSSLGLIISNYSDTMQQAIFVMWFFVVMLMLLSGLFTPTRSMPDLAYLTTYVNPMHYFIDAIRTVFVRGGTLQNILHQVLALAAIGGFMATWAVRSYKKNS